MPVDYYFVRFDADEIDFSDELIQSKTMERIFNSDIVYVVAPNGYAGKTTCYEIGRIVQKNLPIYFSQNIIDLPLYIPNTHIVNKEKLLEIIQERTLVPLYYNEYSVCANVENTLLDKDGI